METLSTPHVDHHHGNHDHEQQQQQPSVVVVMDWTRRRDDSASSSDPPSLVSASDSSTGTECSTDITSSNSRTLLPDDAASPPSSMHSFSENLAVLTKSPTTATTTAPARILRKSVSFGDLEVRKFPIILGDHPDATTGPPVTIGWEVMSSFKIPIDEFETNRLGHRRPHNRLRMHPKTRMQMLERTNTPEEIEYATIQAMLIHEQRMQTFESVMFYDVMKLRIKRMLGLGLLWSPSSSSSSSTALLMKLNKDATTVTNKESKERRLKLGSRTLAPSPTTAIGTTTTTKPATPTVLADKNTTTTATAATTNKLQKTFLVRRSSC